MSRIYLLWDDSQIWGVLAARALRAMELPYHLIRGRDIAQGALSVQKTALLLVPGGNARHKAESLSAAGIEAVKHYVSQGGQYLGFCGGAGLALTADSPQAGLALCPWSRAGFDERMQHFMSGHLHVSLASSATGGGMIPAGLGEKPLLPVWWPSRFAMEPAKGVEVLASYASPAEDFMLADLAVADFPPDILAAWEDMYALSLRPGYLSGQPCLVYGHYGNGSYILSYSHLETPDSRQANFWLAHIITQMTGMRTEIKHLAAWTPYLDAAKWDNPILTVFAESLDEVLKTGLRHGLLFRRTDWLIGWRTGIPGVNLNNLKAALSAILEREPLPAAEAYLKSKKDNIQSAARLFCKGCTEYLLAERLAQTLGKFMPGAMPEKLLKDQRHALFGPPMQAGGLYRELMSYLDELALIQLAQGH